MTSRWNSWHIDEAHILWKRLVSPGDTVIDATCGNGYDTMLLAQLALRPDKGTLFVIDIQAEALDYTRAKLKEALTEDLLSRVTFEQRSHATFPQEIPESSVRLIVYNLGYLPGSDKSVTTRVESTLQSVDHAQRLLCPGGVISITCYPGHPEGKREEEALMGYAASLDAHRWRCRFCRCLNRPEAPSLLFIERRSTFS